MELDICCPTTPRHVTYPSVVDIISDNGISLLYPSLEVSGICVVEELESVR